MEKEHNPDVIVVGSGILGSAVAAVLARDGRKVVVVEKDLREPKRIIGELLQPGGRRALNMLGLEGCTENIDAHPIRGYVIHDRKTNTEVQVPYPVEEGGLTSGVAFHHGRFVMALRRATMDEPNTQYIEGTVTQLLEEDNIITGIRYTDKITGKMKKLHASLTIVADGCFSKFRKDLVREKPLIKSHFIGMIMNNCPQRRQNHAELVLADPNPILIYQISSTCTRVLVDVRDKMPSDTKYYLANVIYPQMPDHLKEPFMDAIQNNDIHSMPNSYLAPAPLEKPGVMCLGDAMNMRHPLTGGGMSVALNDVVIVRELFEDISDLTDYPKVLQAGRELLSRRNNNHSFVVNVLSMALYELFSARDEHLKSLKRACFDYFKLGGECVNGPVGLLSVLNPRPHVLMVHFFAVAMYAVYHTFTTEHWWTLHRSVYKSAGILWKACGVIFPLVWSEIKPTIKLM